MTSAAIMDARALLATFRASPWRTLHIRTGAVELFLAKAGGDANPMRARRPAAVAVADTVVAVTAPHVATFVSAEAIGTAVAAGQGVARIELLGEPIEVVATQAGRVAGHPVVPGTLLDYGAALVTIAVA